MLTEVAAIGALLFYFGWARTRATYAYFGLDVSVLGLTSADYVLRSINTITRPALAAALIALVALLAYHWIGTLPADRRVRVARVAVGAGVGVTALGAAGVLATGRQTVTLIGSIALVAGLALAGYGLALWRPHLNGRLADAATTRHAFLLLGALMLVALLWALTAYAGYIGRAVAVSYERFLLPAGWRRGDGPVIVLPDPADHTIRLEFQAGPG